MIICQLIWLVFWCFFCEVSGSDEEENKDDEDKSCFTPTDCQSKNFRNVEKFNIASVTVNQVKAQAHDHSFFQNILICSVSLQSFFCKESLPGDESNLFIVNSLFSKVFQWRVVKTELFAKTVT